jgi:hypothetical protein
MTGIAETKVRTRVRARRASRYRESITNDDHSIATDFESTSSPDLSLTPETVESLGRHSSACLLVRRPTTTVELKEKVPRPMTTDWKGIAIPLFFRDYVFHSSLMKGNFNFLATSFNRPNASPALKSALNAVAWMSLANKRKIIWLSTEAKGCYLESVGNVAKLLGDPATAREDDVMICNCLFGLFEVRTTVQSCFNKVVLAIDFHRQFRGVY